MELSILIPARNEMFLKNTIDDILKNIEADTEVIVVLDGQWADLPIDDHERVNLIYLPEAIGQRAATNLACKLSRAKYVMKVDAHCLFDKGFDKKMIAAFKEAGDNVTMVPVMSNLHAFNWKCLKCGNQWYQGPTPVRCMTQVSAYKIENNLKCNSKKFTRKMIWKPRRGTHNQSYCFDAEPHFQYFSEYKRRPEYIKALEKTGLTETMSLQGSCFMVTREKYWELNLCDESFGSWGNQGIEVAVKTWLSGGRVLCNHKTWYAHLFRTQGQDFGFPYQQSGREIEECKQKVRDLFWNNKFNKQIYPLRWLIKKFMPVKGWTQEDLDKLK